MSNNRTNITHLTNQATSEYNRQQDLLMRKRRHLKKRMQMILAVGSIMLIMPAISLGKDLLRKRDFDAQKVQATEQLADLETYQDDLEYYIDLLNDEEYVAKLARSEYYLSKDDEVVFNLPEDYIPDHQRVIDEFHEAQSQKAKSDS